MATVANTWQYVQTYTGPEGAFAANVMHLLRVSASFTQTAIDEVQQAWQDNMSAVMNGNWGISGSCLFTDLSNAALPQFVSGNDDRSGAGSGNTLPPACCLCVGISAGVGKTKHGRMYIPGIGVADVDGGGIGAALAGDAVDAFTAYVGAVATSPGVLPAIYSRKDGVARSLLTASVDDVLDTQRRRQQRIHS